MKSLFKTTAIVSVSLVLFFACKEAPTLPFSALPTSATELFYLSHVDSLKNSISLGVPGKGSMKNGKIIPYSGVNFHYFSKVVKL